MAIQSVSLLKYSSAITVDSIKNTNDNQLLVTKGYIADQISGVTASVTVDDSTIKRGGSGLYVNAVTTKTADSIVKTNSNGYIDPAQLPIAFTESSPIKITTSSSGGKTTYTIGLTRTNITDVYVVSTLGTVTNGVVSGGRATQTTIQAGDIVIEKYGTTTDSYMYVGSTANAPTEEGNWVQLTLNPSVYVTHSDYATTVASTGTSNEKTTAAGIASFDSAKFTVTDGFVTLAETYLTQHQSLSNYVTKTTYAQVAASAATTKIGFSSFDSTSFSVGNYGFISLKAAGTSSSDLGGVYVDDNTLQVASDGKISVKKSYLTSHQSLNGYVNNVSVTTDVTTSSANGLSAEINGTNNKTLTLTMAYGSSSAYGAVMVDGTTIEATNGVINVKSGVYAEANHSTPTVNHVPSTSNVGYLFKSKNNAQGEWVSISSITTSLSNAKADGSTKGIAAFNSTHFTASSGIIDLKETYLTTAAASTDYQAKISTSGATSGQVLSWNGEAFTWVNQTSAYTLTAATDSALGGVSIPATATSYLTNDDGAIGVSIKTGGGLDYDDTTNASGIYVKITNKGTYAASTDYAIGDIVYCSKNSYYGSLPFIVKDKHTTGTSLTTMPTLTNAGNTSTSGLKLTPLVLVASTSVSGVVMVNGTSTQMENGVLKVGLVENGGLTNITTGTSKGLKVDYGLVADNILDSVGGFDSWTESNSSAKTYYVGDVVHWEGSLYKCIQQYTTNTGGDTREPGYAGGMAYWQETDFRNAYKYSGTATVATNNDAFIEIEHKLGTKDITVQVYQTDSADPDQETTRIPVLVEFEFGKTETYKSNLANNTNIIKKNNITLRFANSQSNSQYYRVVILAAR